MGNERWVSFSPTQITWYRSHIQDEVKGTLKITPDTTFYLGGSITVVTEMVSGGTYSFTIPFRTLVVQFWDRSDADRWLFCAYSNSTADAILDIMRKSRS